MTMKVKCDGCEKVINVPDDKIPADRPLAFNCPSCKRPLSVSRPPDSTSGVGLPDMGGIPETTPPPPLDQTQDVPILSAGGLKAPPLPDMREAIESELDMLGEGRFRALVAEDANLDRLMPVLKKLEYVITVIKSHDEGVQKLALNRYDLIILNERFAGADPANNTLHKTLEPLPMETRRGMFVVMTGKNFKTLDNMTAFSRSVNLVVNESDFGNFELILKKAMNDNDAFYRVFRKMLVETGKELA